MISSVFKFLIKISFANKGEREKEREEESWRKASWGVGEEESRQVRSVLHTVFHGARRTFRLLCFSGKKVVWHNFVHGLSDNSILLNLYFLFMDLLYVCFAFVGMILPYFYTNTHTHTCTHRSFPFRVFSLYNAYYFPFLVFVAE